MERTERASDADAPLPGGWQTTVHRVGENVRRSPSRWSRSTLHFLQHLERAGFDGSPRPVGSGFDDDGNELLTYVEGVSPQPDAWSDEAIATLGEMLASMHVAARSHRPPIGAVWQDGPCSHLGQPLDGFGHGDLGPWNITAVDGLPVGFIDWDTAGPMDPVYELAQVAWLNVQLHDDDIAERVGLGGVHHRARQLRVLLDAYGASREARIGFVDKMIEVAVLDSAHEAIEHEVTPDTVSGLAAGGYPVTWAIAWRVRSAAWMLRHREVLDDAARRPR